MKDPSSIFTEEEIQAEIRRQRAEAKRAYYRRHPERQKAANARYRRNRAIRALEARRAEQEGGKSE